MKEIWGFTLIEVLIVMLIISIVSGIAILTVSPNSQKETENFANQLSQTIRLASEEAMLRPGTIGLALTENSYQFYLYQSSKKEDPWEKLPNKVFDKHVLPKKIHMTLSMQNKAMTLNGKPRIIISESGDITPFILKFILQEKSLYQINGKATGEINVETVDEK